MAGDMAQFLAGISCMHLWSHYLAFLFTVKMTADNTESVVPVTALSNYDLNFEKANVARALAKC